MGRVREILERRLGMEREGRMKKDTQMQVGVIEKGGVRGVGDGDRGNGRVREDMGNGRVREDMVRVEV